MKRLRKIVPAWAIHVAFDFRCILRRWRIGGIIPFRAITSQPAVVIAPHPDDETFGCAALISLKRQASVPVRVVFLTSGEAVASGVNDTPERVTRVRKAQALAACQHLGVQAADVHWLNLTDGKLPRPGQPGFDDVVKRLVAELEDFPLGEIYSPHPNDMHPDHVAAEAITKRAVELSGKPLRLIHYPIWLWFHASGRLKNRLNTHGAWRLDGRAVASKKIAAISEYLDDPEKAASGNPYCGKLPWGFLWNFRHAAEVFFESREHD